MASCEEVTSPSGLRTIRLENECLSPFDTTSVRFPGSGCGSTTKRGRVAVLSPDLNLGLEPSTSPCESLTEAVAEGWTEQLEPGKIRTWSLSVEVGA